MSVYFSHILKQLSKVKHQINTQLFEILKTTVLRVHSRRKTGRCWRAVLLFDGKEINKKHTPPLSSGAGTPINFK